MISSLDHKYSLFSLLHEIYPPLNIKEKSLPKSYLIMASDPKSKISFEVLLHPVCVAPPDMENYELETSHLHHHDHTYTCSNTSGTQWVKDRVTKTNTPMWKGKG